MKKASSPNPFVPGSTGCRQHSPSLVEEQMPLPLTEVERAASWKAIQSLSRANRFQLMFGRPFLPEFRGD
jgi:hypothetical protein